MRLERCLLIFKFLQYGVFAFTHGQEHHVSINRAMMPQIKFSEFEPLPGSQATETTHYDLLEVQWAFDLQPFSGPTVYDNEEDADIHGVAYGQRIIDEKMPGLKAG